MDRTGRCVNFGNCTIANQKQTITMPTGLELKCPECGRALVEVTGAKASSSTGPILVAAVLLGLAGWWFLQTRSKPSTSSSTQTTSSGGGTVMLRLQGSNTIGAQLAPALAEAFLKAQGTQDVQVIHDSAEMIRVVGGGKTIAIEARGSATAFAGLAAGQCEIGMASRPVKAEGWRRNRGRRRSP